MRIYADENMPLVQQFFADLGDVHLFNGRTVKAQDIADADILLVRSVTEVNEALIAECKSLRFVGTATIGMEHIDQDYLKSRQIAFSSAPGCNAQSVMEYVLSSLWFLADKYQWQLRDKTVAVVGCGNIGSRLVNALNALNIKVLQCDPIRAASESAFNHTDFSKVCELADIISFHTPLIKEGAYATKHLLHAGNLSALKPDCAIINAARGAIIDNQALLEHLQSPDSKRAVVLDVWENEPNILSALLPLVDIATAHIAGHSVEGKARGTQMLYQHCCELFKKPILHELNTLLPEAAVQKLQITERFSLLDVQSVSRLLYDVRRDDALLRHFLPLHGFDWLRKTYPARREFGSLQLCGKVVPNYLLQLGFSLEH